MYEIPVGTVIQEVRSEWQWRLDYLLGDEISGLGEGEMQRSSSASPVSFGNSIRRSGRTCAGTTWEASPWLRNSGARVAAGC